MKSTNAFTVTLCALSALVINSCGSGKNSAPSFDLSAYHGPTFTLPLAKTNEIVRFTDYLGKGAPVVLNFWGTWCGPCRREMPDLKEVYAEYKPRGVEFVGVALRENALRVNKYTEQNGIEWPQVVGMVQTAMDYGRITGVPTTIIYDSKGGEFTRRVGPLRSETLRKLLDQAIEHEKTLKNPTT